VETDSEPRPFERVIDPYWVLGVGRDASPEQIDAAYRRAAGNAWSYERRREIDSAYELLSSPERRAEYDAHWRSNHRELVPVPAPVHHSRNPVDRLTAGLPRPWRVAIDWAVTIVGAVAIVLAIKAWVVNPYRIPSSSMEPTLHCAVPGEGCEARFSDRVLANRLIYHFRDPKRGDIIVFNTPARAVQECGAGGTFVEPPPRRRLHQQQAARRVVHQGGEARDRHAAAAEGTTEQLHLPGRQPHALVRLAPVGLGAAREPDRQGVRGLLAAEPDFR
jgi:Signal peptidase, peptidase S26/DnaJ domain